MLNLFIFMIICVISIVVIYYFVLFFIVFYLVKIEFEEFLIIWNLEDINSFDGIVIKMEDIDNGLGLDFNYMEGGSSMYFN